MFRKLSAASSRGANATKQSILVAAAQWIASLVLAMTAQILLCALSLPTVPRHRRSSSLPLAGRVARSAGWGWFAKGYSPPPVTSFAPLTMCHPPHKVGGIRKSGRDKKESRRCCACSLIRCEKRTRRSNPLSPLQWIASLRSQQRTRPLGCLKFKSEMTHNRVAGLVRPSTLSYKAAHVETQKSAKAGVALADQFVASSRGVISEASKPPRPWQRSAPTRWSSGSGKRSGRGRLASSGGDLPDSPCSRC
jgi:hypothetical protein